MRLILQDVRHLPDIHMNLISLSKLDNEGFAIPLKVEHENLLKAPQ